MFTFLLRYTVLENNIISINYILLSLPMAFWVMLPAFVPNSAAALLGGGTPIDRGITFLDGRRIFGNGKTYKGFFLGIICGIATGFLLIFIEGRLGWQIHTPLSVVLLASGALLGDLAKSFFKRRLNKKQGEQWLIADQYDLVIGAFVLLLVFDFSWFIETITPAVAFWIIVITPLLHRGINIIGYLIGVKDVPW
jgi:CDP-2,3-bis-(O-geranylgeranyl)-sn-glycerol synthase